MQSTLAYLALHVLSPVFVVVLTLLLLRLAHRLAPENWSGVLWLSLGSVGALLRDILCLVWAGGIRQCAVVVMGSSLHFQRASNLPLRKSFAPLARPLAGERRNHLHVHPVSERRRMGGYSGMAISPAP